MKQRNQRAISLILALALCLGLAVPALAAGGFADVNPGDYYEQAVAWAVEKNITSGTSETTFSPKDTCTKGQILTFLWRAAGSPEPQDTARHFPGVTDPGQYYYKACQWAYEQTVENDQAFTPNSPCTRAAVVQYIWRAKGAEQARKAAAFTDIPNDPESPLFQAVSWAVEQGVTSGTSETAFSPNDTCTRGQIVTFLHRAFAEQQEQPENQDPDHLASNVDMSKIKGLYRQEKDPDYEIEAWYSAPRLNYEIYSMKSGTRQMIESGYMTISGAHAYANASDGSRQDIWVYPDSLTYESSRPGSTRWHGKYILVNPQEEAEKQRRQEEKDRQMDEKYPASDVDMREINALYRLDGSDRYQISVRYSDPKMSFTLEDRQEEDTVYVPYSSLNISGTHAYFDSEKHNYRTDIWFYPDYLILEFSGEGAKDLQKYAGRYTLHWSSSGQN